MYQNEERTQFHRFNMAPYGQRTMQGTRGQAGIRTSQGRHNTRAAIKQLKANLRQLAKIQAFQLRNWKQNVASTIDRKRSERDATQTCGKD